MPISRDFFARHAVEVAPDLLGCVLEHQTADGLVAVELTEVEAYAGRSDPASHAYRGKTPRNAVMFGPPGHAYVYFTYGMHFCVNLVCLGEEGSASAVLLRAGAIIEGEDLARARRAGGAGPGHLARPGPRPGPALPGARHRPVAGRRGRLRRRFAAPGACRGRQPGPFGDCAGPGERTREPSRNPQKIVTGPRVGVSSAAEIPWRFWYEGEPTVSVYRAHVPRRRKLVTP